MSAFLLSQYWPELLNVLKRGSYAFELVAGEMGSLDVAIALTMDVDGVDANEDADEEPKRVARRLRG